MSFASSVVIEKTVSQLNDSLVSQPITPRTRVANAPTTMPLKGRYVADVHDVEVMKKIKQNEVELRDRILHGIVRDQSQCKEGPLPSRSRWCTVDTAASFEKPSTT
jgi:hypothetical protein